MLVRRNARFVLSLIPVVLSLVACGGDDGGSCSTDAYPAAPDGATSLLHVAAGCAAEGADGSRGRPYPTIGAALAVASPGATVLIAPGSYPERLRIDRDVTLVGSSSPTDASAAAAVIAPGGSPISGAADASSQVAVAIRGAADVRLIGLAIRGATLAGVQVSAARATLQGVSVEGTEADAEGGYGYGIAATDDGSIILQNSAVTGSSGAGVLVSRAAARIEESSLLDNGGAGIWVEDASDEVAIERNRIERNKTAGLVLFGSRAIILQNVIRATARDAQEIGDGVIVAGAEQDAEVTLDDNQIEDNARAGALFAAGTRSIILQRNRILRNAGDAGFGAGVWIQEDAAEASGSAISENLIAENSFVGIGMTGDTHGIILQRNEIADTKLAETFLGLDIASVGDGIGIFAGASADIVDNTVRSSARIGLILDGAKQAATRIQGNRFEGNVEYGIILQNQELQSDPSPDNDFSMNGQGDVKTALAGEYDVVTDALATGR